MLGTNELLIVLGIAALLFGANKLPEFARSLGSSVGEFKKAKLESEREIEKLKDDKV